MYRFLLLKYPTTRLKVDDLVSLVIRIQSNIYRNEEPEAVHRLEVSLREAFLQASKGDEYIGEDDFVRCMVDVDRRAPMDHYDKYLRRVFHLINTKGTGITREQYLAFIESAFDIMVSPEQERKVDALLKGKEVIDLPTFLELSKRSLSFSS